jgi:hypothetical protein
MRARTQRAPRSKRCATLHTPAAMPRERASMGSPPTGDLTDARRVASSATPAWSRCARRSRSATPSSRRASTRRAKASRRTLARTRRHLPTHPRSRRPEIVGRVANRAKRVLRSARAMQKRANASRPSGTRPPSRSSAARPRVSRRATKMAADPSRRTPTTMAADPRRRTDRANAARWMQAFRSRLPDEPRR